MQAHQELAAVRAVLADCVGQRIVSVEMPDSGCVGLRLEAGELVLLAVDWQLFTSGAQPPAR